jgi:hypothetical protein
MVQVLVVEPALSSWMRQALLLLPPTLISAWDMQQHRLPRRLRSPLPARPDHRRPCGHLLPGRLRRAHCPCIPLLLGRPRPGAGHHARPRRPVAAFCVKCRTCTATPATVAMRPHMHGRSGVHRPKERTDGTVAWIAACLAQAQSDPSAQPCHYQAAMSIPY